MFDQNTQFTCQHNVDLRSSQENQHFRVVSTVSCFTALSRDLLVDSLSSKTQPVKHVVVTGDFDDWTKSIRLEWNPEEERYEASVELPPALGERIAYKYIVDGEWKHNQDKITADDGFGSFNNILTSRVPKARLPTGVNTARATEAYKQQFTEVSVNLFCHSLLLYSPLVPDNR